MRKGLTYTILTVLSVLYLFPVFWVVVSSFKDQNELYQWPPSLFPANPTFQNYVIAFDSGNFDIYFLNSTIVTITSTLLWPVLLWPSTVFAGTRFC